MSNIKERNSSIELLRIICMIMIIINHYTYFGGAYKANFMLTVGMVGEWAVNLFIVIFGYFGITSRFKAEKLFGFYSQVWFYSVVGFLVHMMIANAVKFDFKVLFPVITSQYWFFTQYIFLYLMMPFLNKMLTLLNKSAHLALIVILGILWVMIPIFIPDGVDYILKGNMSCVFVLLYCIGAYIRKHLSEEKAYEKALGILIVLLCFAVTWAYEFLKMKNTVTFQFEWLPNDSIISVMFPIGMMLIFKNIHIPTSRLINNIASCAFGVYLIHENPNIRHTLWGQIIKLPDVNHCTGPFLFWHMIGTSILVFAVCALIDFIRQKTIHKIWEKYVIMKIAPAINKKISFLNK